MSVDISVSSNKNLGCKDIIEILRMLNINAKTIETVSILEKDIETGCQITLGREYIDKDKLSELWRLIGKSYKCSHLKIDGIYNGCIYNYISKSLCPGEY